MRYVVAILFLWLTPLPSLGDELRPAFLEIREVESERYEALWRVPVKAGRSADLAPLLPDNCQRLGPERVEAVERGAVRRDSRFGFSCQGDLGGQSLTIDGLGAISADVIIRISYRDGTGETHRAHTFSPSVTLTGTPSLFQVVASYLGLGFEHILLGIDHLLFVMALILLVPNLRLLFWTVTAFTVAHSLTLAAAALGWISLPGALVEALIALSIVVVAAEAFRKTRGQETVTSRHPWIVAFLFGLMHGFGFAGAVQEIGLPDNAVLVALLFFNIGVELGQIVFVAAILALCAGWRVTVNRNNHIILTALPYAIGSLAAMWTIERVLAFY